MNSTLYKSTSENAAEVKKKNVIIYIPYKDMYTLNFLNNRFA